MIYSSLPAGSGKDKSGLRFRQGEMEKRGKIHRDQQHVSYRLQIPLLQCAYLHLMLTGSQDQYLGLEMYYACLEVREFFFPRCIIKLTAGFTWSASRHCLSLDNWV